MKEPIITWFVKNEEENFIPREEYNAGIYTKGKKLIVEMQVWNNRWGIEDVDDLKNPVINLYFETLEDSVLLNMCKISVDEVENMPLIITGQKASVFINKDIKGTQNNGDQEESNLNFINIKFEFEAPNYRLKENDLKNLYFEIVPMD
jgi:hypothetical protein